MATLKAVTLHQPWAEAIAYGLKKYETRSWRTSYTGLLAIHAGKTVDSLVLREASWRHQEFGWEMATGAMVALAVLEGCCRTEELRGSISEDERFWGDWSPRRWAWHLTSVRRLLEPIECPGHQGLWTPSPEVVEGIVRRRSCPV